MLAQSMKETEIAENLNVDQYTISRDVKTLKEMSQQFVFNLAKSDLAYYYKHCINGIEEVRKKESMGNIQKRRTWTSYSIVTGSGGFDKKTFKIQTR